MAAGNVDANHLQTYIHQRFPNRGLFLSSAPQPLRHPARDPACCLIMETLHHPKYLWRYQPRLWPKQQDMLYHCEVEHPKRPRVCPLPYPCLLPPPQEQRGAGPLLFFQRDVENLIGGYVLGHGVMAAGNVDANHLQTYIHQRFPNRGLFLSSAPQPLRHPARDPACCLIMETLHHPKYLWRYQPRLWPKQQDMLYHCEVERPKRPRVCPLPYKHVGEPPPFLPCLLEVHSHRYTFNVFRWK